MRPSKYAESYGDVLVKLMSEGASLEEVAGELGVAKSTLYTWFKNFPEFQNARELGIALSEAWWLKQGRIALRQKEFNSSLYYMNMKNRFRWRDRHDVTTNDKDLPTPLLANIPDVLPHDGHNEDNETD